MNFYAHLKAPQLRLALKSVMAKAATKAGLPIEVAYLLEANKIRDEMRRRHIVEG